MTEQKSERAETSADNREKPLNRAQFNAANEKLLEDQLEISEPKAVDYVPGEN